MEYIGRNNKPLKFIIFSGLKVAKIYNGLKTYKKFSKNFYNNDQIID